MSKSIKKIVMLLVLSSVVLVGSVACGVIDNFVDCNHICNRYKECVDDKYDAASCRTRCREKADSDKNYSAKANECSACLDDRACGQSLPCTLQCVGIVP